VVTCGVGSVGFLVFLGGSWWIFFSFFVDRTTDRKLNLDWLRVGWWGFWGWLVCSWAGLLVAGFCFSSVTGLAGHCF